MRHAITILSLFVLHCGPVAAQQPLPVPTVEVDGFTVAIPPPPTMHDVVIPDGSPGWKETQWSAYLAETINVPPEHVEYRLPSGARIDIWNGQRGVAWEVEWCSKWEQAFGQAGRYAAETGGTAGVWLLVRPNDDEDYLEAVMTYQWYRRQGVNIVIRVTRVPAKPVSE